MKERRTPCGKLYLELGARGGTRNSSQCRQDSRGRDIKRILIVPVWAESYGLNWSSLTLYRHSVVPVWVVVHWTVCRSAPAWSRLKLLETSLQAIEYCDELYVDLNSFQQKCRRSEIFLLQALIPNILGLRVSLVVLQYLYIYYFPCNVTWIVEFL